MEEGSVREAALGTLGVEGGSREAAPFILSFLFCLVILGSP